MSELFENFRSNSIKQKDSIRSNGTFGPKLSLAFDNENYELRKDDYKFSGGIIKVFKNAQGNYHFLVIGLVNLYLFFFFFFLRLCTVY